MAINTTIVEQLQELRRWQLQQQEKLIRQQQEQRDMLSDEQNRRYQEALSSSIEEMSLDDQALKELVAEHKKKEENLINFDTPDEECLSPALQKKNNNNNKGSNLKVQNMPLAGKSTKTGLKPSIKYNDSYSFNEQDYSLDHSVNSMFSLSSGRFEKQNISIDEIPLPSPKKDFNTLLEERLRDPEAMSIENGKKPVVKRPFLKKGQGLARFMPNSNPNKMSKSSTRSRSTSFTSSNQSGVTKPTKSINLGRSNSVPKSKSYDTSRRSISNLTPISQQKLNLKNVQPPRKKTLNRSAGSITHSNSFEKKKPPEIVSDANSSDLELKSKKEQEEVRIFELLEDKAENSSFCSTSSTVIAFLQQSTPLKHKALLHSASKHKISLNDIGDETFEEIVSKAKSNYHPPVSQQQKNVKDTKISHWKTVPVSKLKNDKTVTGTVLPYGTDIDQNYKDYISNKEESQDENNASLHVRFSEYNEYKTMTDTSSISSDSQTIINYINDKGAWSDCSVTPDSSDVESIMSSEVKRSRERESKVISSLNFLNKNQNDSDEDDTEDYKNKDDNEDESDIKNETLQKEDTIIDEKNESTSLFKSEVLKTRLLELEQEIEIFRKESAALSLQRQKLQEERTKLQEERINMQRSFKEKEEALEMEKKKTENLLQEERKKLAREKAALESRMKDAYEKAQKSKQERQEIQTLRDQLEELKEEYSQKESKWSATSARQRSQMRVLQTENSKLKQELEKIQQKKNAKLRKPVTSNTKAIHHINKFLADRKKISPFKNDDAYEEERKMPNNKADNNAENYNAVLEPMEHKPQEEVVEKKKILKSAESIARSRDLYERLLMDATEGFCEIQMGKRILMNQRGETPEPTVEDHSNNEENNYDEESDVEIKNILNSESPKTHRVMDTESENFYNDRNNEVEQQKFKNNKQGIREVHHPDGRVEYWYPNGNVKKIFPDKCLTKMIYYNGDVRETDKNGTIKYFYASTRTWHTTMPDGLEILEFPDGQVERRSKNGTVEVSFPDGSVKILQSDGSEKWALKDGTIAETSADGEKVLTLPNGQREIHTKDHKRREYPDGTIKLVYPDGIQETRYANGRIRLKDKDGNLIMDTHQ